MQQIDVHNLYISSDTNNMKINVTKFELMRHENKQEI